MDEKVVDMDKFIQEVFAMNEIELYLYGWDENTWFKVKSDDYGMYMIEVVWKTHEIHVYRWEQVHKSLQLDGKAWTILKAIDDMEV